MPILESIIGVVTASTAKSITTFLYEKVENYIHKKYNNTPPDEIEKLRTEIEVLKSQMDTKTKDEIEESELNQVKEKVSQIEQNQSPLPADEISGEVFHIWSQKDDLTINDQTALLLRQFELLDEKALDIGISEKKRTQIQSMIISIEMNLEEYSDAKFEADLSGTRQDKEAAFSAERLLKRNLFQARDFLRQAV